jgi:hypothetical protein
LQIIITLFAEWWLVLMLIYRERKILLNGWLILADKFKRTGLSKDIQIWFSF